MARRLAEVQAGRDYEEILSESAEDVWLERFQSPRMWGVGGMARIWRAYDLRLERWVAIKGTRGSNGGRRDRLVREAKLLARMHHPALVQVYDLVKGPSLGGSKDNTELRWWIILELVEGETLTERVKRTGPLSPEEVTSMGRYLAGGLAEAHAHGLVHRDLSSSNVLLSARGQPKIVDFGIARSVPAAVESQATSESGSTEFETDSGMILGTPGFIAPERLEGVVGDVRTDLYGLGALLYLAVTGLRVHEDKSSTQAQTKQLIRRSVTRPAPDPRLVRAECPTELAACIQRLLSRDPDKRPHSAAEAERWLGELELQLRCAIPRARRPRLSSRQNREIPVWGLYLVLALMAALLCGWMLIQL